MLILGVPRPRSVRRLDRAANPGRGPNVDWAQSLVAGLVGSFIGGLISTSSGRRPGPAPERHHRIGRRRPHRARHLEFGPALEASEGASRGPEGTPLPSSPLTLASTPFVAVTPGLVEPFPPAPRPAGKLSSQNAFAVDHPSAAALVTEADGPGPVGTASSSVSASAPTSLLCIAPGADGGWRGDERGSVLDSDRAKICARIGADVVDAEVTSVVSVAPSELLSTFRPRAAERASVISRCRRSAGGQPESHCDHGDGSDGGQPVGEGAHSTLAIASLIHSEAVTSATVLPGRLVDSCAPGFRMAEVDGNRTRRTGIARSNRFEGGGAHQVLGHLRFRTVAGRGKVVA